MLNPNEQCSGAFWGLFTVAKVKPSPVDKSQSRNSSSLTAMDSRPGACLPMLELNPGNKQYKNTISSKRQRGDKEDTVHTFQFQKEEAHDIFLYGVVKTEPPVKDVSEALNNFIYFILQQEKITKVFYSCLDPTPQFVDNRDHNKKPYPIERITDMLNFIDYLNRGCAWVDAWSDLLRLLKEFEKVKGYDKSCALKNAIRLVSGWVAYAVSRENGAPTSKD